MDRYAERLPTGSTSGNISLADVQARLLRKMLAADLKGLPDVFAAHLVVLIEEHTGLCVYYPEVQQFYDDVRSGVQTIQLSQDAVDGLLGTLKNNPAIFDKTVGQSVSVAAETVIVVQQVKADEPQLSQQNIALPPDPLGPLHETSARDFTVASALNRIWKVFKQGKAIRENAEEWQKAGNEALPWINRILDYLNGFGGGPPNLPPTISL